MWWKYGVDVSMMVNWVVVNRLDVKVGIFVIYYFRIEWDCVEGF